MVYHKFSNLGKILQGDLSSKLIKRVKSLDFESLKYDCNSKTKTDGECIYDGKCRYSIVVYKETFKVCDKLYIGNIQKKLNMRMNQHFTDVHNLVNKYLNSDSYTKHVATHFFQK